MTAHEQIEIELKFDVAAGRPIPDLTALPGVASTSEPIEENLDATYFDTENLDLADNRITLRRRTGGHDEGWHLKRPAGAGGRRERQVPLDPDDADPATGIAHATVPAELLEPVRVHVRGRTLSPVAVIGTRRQITEARGDDGRLLAVLCADLVTARSLLPGGTGQTWSEWEFELVGENGGDTDLLGPAEELLRGAGATTASSASKLARTIGAMPGHRSTKPLPTKPTALELVITELSRHRDQLVEWDPAVRADADDAVHQMRVATRRLRSVLRAFDSVLGGAARDTIGDELKELASVLGVARDAEVTAQRYAELLADENASDALRAALVDEQTRRYRRGLRVAVTGMNSARYFALLDAIDEYLVDPVAGPDAERPAKKALRDAVDASRRSVRKAQRRLARHDRDTEEWTEQMHTVRKKAKRLRYIAEAGATLGISRHKQVGATAKKIQSLLGDANDATLSRELLAEVATTLSSPTDAFVLGRLDAREEERHAEALRRYDAIADDL
ncbi:CYTH and CHAD domain-containing protein [Williamsia herbipolensis]|uniref:CYTH and CHAD domain-containing protein n=1 Tax=Williamsia herbipolensis TaxID=1603258 RepID=UPI0005F77BB4|nr:CYTH and CHAD domain-containing protein [Williamsia herbipolensis]